MRIFTLLIILIFSLRITGQEIIQPVGNYHFIENKGQWPNGVLFSTDVDGGKIWIEQGRVMYQFNDYSEVEKVHHDHDFSQKKPLQLKQSLLLNYFEGANTISNITKKYPTRNYYNYFLGNDKTHWAENVRGYSHVILHDLYDNIDLHFMENEGSLKYEFHAAPNSNPEAIIMRYEGVKKIKILNNGNLEVTSELGKIEEQKPYAYQIKNGKIIEVPCEFVITKANRVNFKLGAYDRSLELIVDPVLVFATYCGSVTDNFGMTATYAYDGKGYSGGMVYGNAYPAPAPAWNTTTNITVVNLASPVTTDVFVSKYSEDGTTMLWTNFIGGGDNSQGTETVHSLICDSSNNVYLYGATSSTDFPIVDGFQTSHGGGSSLSVAFNGTNFGTQGTDIYVAKFSSDGMNLMGSTYVGGSSNDGVNYKITSGTYSSVSAYDSLTTNYGDQFRGEIMLDSIENIIICSSSRSTDFPTVTPFQPSNAGQQDAVIFKIANDFSGLIFSSYYGGAQNDAGFSTKIDSTGNIIFAGGTSSNDLPLTVGGVQPTYGGGKCDGYVAKLNPDGTIISQSTYVGTSSYDQVFFVEVDRFDNIFLVGQSLGSMPVSAGVYSNPGSTQFIWKLNPDLTATDYTTVFGNGSGTIDISPSAFLVDVCGNVYVSGWGANILQPVGLSGMPVTADAFQGSSPNGFDFYMIVLERDAASLLYGSYLGGDVSEEHVDGGTSRFDKYGIVYQSVCGGCGSNSDFPTTAGAWSADNLSPNCNNLLFKFDFEIIPVADFEVDLLEGCAPLTLNFDNESNDTINSVWEFGPGATVISPGVNPEVLFDTPGTYEVTLYVTDTICNLTDTAKKIINVYEALELEVPNDTVICASGTWDIWANSNGTATSFIWSDQADFSTVLNAGGMDSVISVTPTANTTYYVTASNGWALCDLIDSVQVFFVDGAMDIMPDTSACLGDTLSIYASNLLPGLTTLTYDWSPNSNIISESDSSAIVNPPTSMYYYVTATTDLGCTLYDSIWIDVSYIDPSTVIATAEPDTIPEGGSSVLTVNPPGYSYIWSPIFNLSNPIGQTTEATNINQTTYFEVEVSDGVCSQKTQVVVHTYEFICGDVYIYVPNAFSPDGDNINDVLYVRGLNLEEIDLKIFDRWGELVFETQNQNIGWDGTFNGRELDPDVYVFHLRVVCFDEQENLIKGNITLIR